MARLKKQKKVKMTRSQAKIFNEKHFGKEPEIFAVVPPTNLELIKVYNWYNTMCLRSDATEFIYDYLSVRDKNKLKALKKISDQRIPTSICWAARLLDRGSLMPEGISEKITATIDEIIEKYTEVEEPASNVISLVDRTKERESFFIGDIEEMIDKNSADVYNYLTTNSVPKAYVPKIISYYEPILSELKSIATDKKIAEGYKGYSRKEIASLIEIYESVIADAERYIEIKKITRKPRAKKKISAEKKVAGVKYCERNDEFQIVSKNPVVILDAKEFWIFDARYKDVYRYVANEGGFQIRGTTLENFNPAESQKWYVGKKAKEAVGKILSEGKIGLRNYFKTMKAREDELTGRINKNMLILKSI